MAREKAKVGDIVKGWKILDIYYRQSGNQKISYAKVVSTIGEPIEKEYRLTKLTLRQVGWPDRRRPDVSLKNLTHGKSDSRLYRIWYGMKNRCLNPKQLSYSDYGGRGITICNYWLDFNKFAMWAEANGYSEELTLDRRDVDGDYCPENCRWVKWTEQTSNKRNSTNFDVEAFGETKSIYDWSRDSRCTVPLHSLRYRFHAGWNPEDAITKPSERKKKQSLELWLQEKYPDVLAEYASQ